MSKLRDSNADSVVLQQLDSVLIDNHYKCQAVGSQVTIVLIPCLIHVSRNYCTKLPLSAPVTVCVLRPACRGAGAWSLDPAPWRT